MNEAPPIHAPVIGISGSSADSASVRAMMAQISGAGAVPLFLGNHSQRDAYKDIGIIDALVVMGNDADIDPAAYGQARHPKTRSELDTPEGKARAAYEDTLIKLALTGKMPLLGVCAGMQRINVATGGTLHQHVPDLTGHDEHNQAAFGIAPFTPVQAVIIEKNSLLGAVGEGISAIYTPTHTIDGKGIVINENSMHHQAVAKVGAGLRPCAQSQDRLPDGTNLIEAIEADPKGKYGKQFLVGVQFHPEFSASPLGANLASHLAREARIFARIHNRRHNLAQVLSENIVSQNGPAPAAASPKRELELHGPDETPPQCHPDVLKINQGSMTELILRQRDISRKNGERAA